MGVIRSRADVEHADIEAGERRDPFAQALGEVEFAAHRPLGDLGDVLEAACRVGEQLDGLLSDEGGIGVEHDERAARAAGDGSRHDTARTWDPLPTTVMLLSVTM